MTYGTKRADILTGLKVSIVLKQDRKIGKLTEGIVRDILTKSATHSNGIKVAWKTALWEGSKPFTADLISTL